MKKRLEIVIPTDYKDITLKKYIELQKELKNYEDNEDAQTAVMVTYLCGIPFEYISGLSKADFDDIKYKLSQFLNNTDYPLQRFIQIDGIEYGFEPNLNDISYGAYLDISSYDTTGIDENWAKIMSILYRPVTKKIFDGTYEIQTYSGNIDGDKFMNTSMDVNFGTLFFFINLLKGLQKSILKSSKEEDLPLPIKSILERSGRLIPL